MWCEQVKLARSFYPFLPGVTFPMDQAGLRQYGDVLSGPVRTDIHTGSNILSSSAMKEKTEQNSLI